MRSDLMGAWSWNGHLDCGYFFGSDGKGAYFFGGGEKVFEYRDDGDSVMVYYPGELSPSRFRYRIDGDTMSIEDSFGSRVIYKRCDALYRIQLP